MAHRGGFALIVARFSHHIGASHPRHVGGWCVPADRIPTMAAFDEPIACVDVETTGGHPAWHRITEIAIVGMRAGEIEWAWSQLVNPGCRIPPSSSS